MTRCWNDKDKKAIIVLSCQVIPHVWIYCHYGFWVPYKKCPHSYRESEVFAEKLAQELNLKETSNHLQDRS